MNEYSLQSNNENGLIYHQNCEIFLSNIYIYYIPRKIHIFHQKRLILKQY